MMNKDALRAAAGLEPQEPATNGHEEEAPEIISYQDVLDAPDLPERVVPVPQWRRPDGRERAVVIRGLSRSEFLRCKASATVGDKLDEAKFEQALLVASLVSPALNPNTIGAFYKKDVAALGVIIKAIMTHLGADAESIKSDEARAAESGDTL
jgi:hypothetical protein